MEAAPAVYRDQSGRRGTTRVKATLIGLAVGGGLVLLLSVLLLLTQEDLARELARASLSFVTLPVALCILAALVAVAAMAIAYGLGVESRQATCGRSYGLYGRAARRLTDEPVERAARAATSQPSLSGDR